MATTNDTWINVASGASGIGSELVVLAVAVNPGAARSGFVTIAGHRATVTQEAAVAGCNFSISPISITGIFAATAVAMLAGFGVAGIVVLSEVGAEGLSRYAEMVALLLALAAIFLSLGALAGVMSATRTRAFGLALCVWFFFVLFYDLLIIGFTFMLRERSANTMILLSLFGNLVDLVRVSTLLTISDPSIFGAAGAALLKFLGGVSLSQLALGFGIAAWFFAPLWFAGRLLRRLDL